MNILLAVVLQLEPLLNIREVPHFTKDCNTELHTSKL
jgi:hypothetical protein